MKLCTALPLGEERISFELNLRTVTEVLVDKHIRAQLDTRFFGWVTMFEGIGFALGLSIPRGPALSCKRQDLTCPVWN